MMHLTRFTTVILLFVLPSISWASSCPSSCQLDQIKTYFSALDKISRHGSTIEDVDAFLALMHSDVNYVHVEYHANFDKASWRKAFIRNLERGAYQNTEKHEKRIIKRIFGKNHVAIEYAHGVVLENGSWQPTEPLLVLFGFKDGKISLVKELW
ncbi:nuclear transport factor 2 family protein [Alteromonas sediminis]|uniref:Nuclear transport factor 2 family protein n=1 Tax=Alteromonas sediminis TaxID=2259342 RepID=A0A3N5ZBK0_9ALTE|nr:nuclear transport factor 2 family protein [Alteromonas sediminis]RPJ66988.1 nuclear transport factor 2 family protein [Alteromonas sediminis]